MALRCGYFTVASKIRGLRGSLRFTDSARQTPSNQKMLTKKRGQIFC